MFNKLQSYQPIIIKRQKKEQLDQAIDDLLKRQFQLIDRGKSFREFDYGARKENFYWAKLKAAK